MKEEQLEKQLLDEDPEDASVWDLVLSSKNNLGAKRELWSRQAGARTAMALVWLGFFLLSAVGEQFVWATHDGSRIGWKWLQTSSTWGLVFVTLYAQHAALVAVKARSLPDDAALARMLRVIRFWRVMINPLGLMGFLAWYFFARGLEEGFRSDLGERLWSVITVVKHVAPELLILLDIFFRPKPILRLPKRVDGTTTLKNKEFFAVFIVPVAYFAFLTTYVLLGGTNYVGENKVYVDTWLERFGVVFVLLVVLLPCYLAHFLYSIAVRNLYKVADAIDDVVVGDKDDKAAKKKKQATTTKQD